MAPCTLPASSKAVIRLAPPLSPPPAAHDRPRGDGGPLGIGRPNRRAALAPADRTPEHHLVLAPLARRVAGALLCVSALGLSIALALPTISYQTLGSPEEIYSILGGIRALWEDGTPFLGAVVFAFSLVLPTFKLGVAGAIVLRGAASRRSAAVLRALHGAGRWSTLDFWVVGLFVSAVQLGVTRSETRAGIHLFMLAMVAGILATRVIDSALGPAPSRPSRSLPRAWVAPALGRALHLAGSLCLLAAPLPVLLGIKKGILKERAFSLLEAVREQAASGELWLAFGLAGFMAILPLARAAVAGIAHWSSGRPPLRLIALERELSRWCMLDVLALALVIVTVKLDDLAAVTVGPGAVLVAAAGLLRAADAWLLRLRLDVAPPPPASPAETGCGPAPLADT